MRVFPAVDAYLEQWCACGVNLVQGPPVSVDVLQEVSKCFASGQEREFQPQLVVKVPYLP